MNAEQMHPDGFPIPPQRFYEDRHIAAVVTWFLMAVLPFERYIGFLPTVLLAWGCLVGVLTLSVLSQLLQRPLTVKLYSGTIRTDEELQQVVRRWMDVNGVRFVAAGVTWVLTLWYIVARGGYFGVFA